ncbi:MAG: BamA/TamA family outer membrane protein [Candidatus Aminicenantes bacterium]|nr:BamA/TamA family outer membrane protein [Candidatus Aminicenantes bacterium]
MIRKIFLVLLILVCSFVVISAEDEAKGEAKTTGKELQVAALEKKSKDRVIGAPILFYTPETRLAYGAAGSYIFRMRGCKSDSRPSSISPILIYTQEKQFKAQVNADMYLKADDYRLQAEVRFEKYPNKFFGVGINTLENNEESYTSRSAGLFLSFLKKLTGEVNLGIQYHFANWKIVEMEEDGQLAAGKLFGGRDGTISGVSLLVNHDTRDNIYFPMKGDLFELNARVYSKFLGSKYDFSSLSLDLRKYVTLFSNHVLAVQSLVKMQTGDVPFMNLAQMGGQYNMRGYFEGRFRDKNLLVFQAEYRAPLVWRLGLVGFAGFGNVADKFGKLSLAGMRSSYGFGLRLLFDSKEKIQVRMDVGFGEDCNGFYFSIFEAF